MDKAATIYYFIETTNHTHIILPCKQGTTYQELLLKCFAATGKTRLELVYKTTDPDRRMLIRNDEDLGFILEMAGDSAQDLKKGVILSDVEVDNIMIYSLAIAMVLNIIFWVPYYMGYFSWF